ncbi:class I SAM-dependent methyltransferase [Gloeocapsopsis dulcis]|uniref:SAM-dependent methyltransferase n=1 Tax=Gloeocapsopsis dulcis AAB1 = 1H9 TaxID=1433147 RepID=A0A6N8FVS8_9CHRO|nr:class I SAM-dependent methyltransferase [Gloeocapsopsis dulcis]MUL37041.1 SAM-dependent methyltransferase [Gloeocapsopsis dulcis AAB1 = 1H9]WNN87894.1 methyltransferase domain-containing protein [Gloeocapsopsis dulcis]
MEWVIGWWQISIQRVCPTNEQLRQMYNKAAPRWHAYLQFLGYHRAYVKLFRSLQQSGILTLSDRSSICDCGIGTGALSLALAKTADHLKIVGVDISPEMLAKARQFLNQAGVNHQVCQGDVRLLPFNDNTYDLVISAHMLEHLPNPHQGLQEMVRVSRPKAPLIIVVTLPGLLGSLIQLQWGNDCLTPEILVEMMTKVGLTDIHCYSLTGGLSCWTSIACLGFKK